VTDLNKFAEWQAKSEYRTVKIEIGNAGARAWVYDYSLMMGQYVESVEEIDLTNEKEIQERALLDRLKAKYEQKESPCVNMDL